MIRYQSLKLPWRQLAILTHVSLYSIYYPETVLVRRKKSKQIEEGFESLGKRNTREKRTLNENSFESKYGSLNEEQYLKR